MPYFKNENGKKGHTNNEKVMAELEREGWKAESFWGESSLRLAKGGVFRPW